MKISGMQFATEFYSIQIAARYLQLFKSLCILIWMYVGVCVCVQIYIHDELKQPYSRMDLEGQHIYNAEERHLCDLSVWKSFPPLELKKKKKYLINFQWKIYCLSEWLVHCNVCG